MTKVAQIGIGRWGRNITRNLAQLGALAQVCDADDKNLAFVAENYPEVKRTKSFQDILDNPEIKGVVISTPAASHYELGKAALLAGKDVYIEKPIVLSMEHLEELESIAQEKGLIIMEGFLLLYHGAVRRMKKALQEGVVGKISHCYCKRTALGAIRFESSALWDFGPHDLSILSYLLEEEPDHLFANGIKVYDQSGGEEVVMTTMQYKDKFVYMHESWLDPAKDRKCIVVGDKGMLLMDEMAEDGKVKFYKKRVELNPEAKFEHEIFKYLDEGFDVLEYQDIEPLKEECSHFLECIENRQEPISGIQTSKSVLKILLTADQSLKEKSVRYLV